MCNNWTRGVILLFIASAMFGCGPDIPSGAMRSLTNAEQYELLSLDPHGSFDPQTGEALVPKENFRGWKVLGRASIEQ